MREAVSMRARICVDTGYASTLRLSYPDAVVLEFDPSGPDHGVQVCPVVTPDPEPVGSRYATIKTPRTSLACLLIARDTHRYRYLPHRDCVSCRSVLTQSTHADVPAATSHITMNIMLDTQAR